MQWEQIMARLSARKGLAEVVRIINPQWPINVVIVSTHALGTGTNLLKRVAAAALYDAAIWKERALETAAATWMEFKQIKIGAGTAHRLIKRDEILFPDYTTFGEGQNRTAAPDSILEHDLQQWRRVWTRLGVSPAAPWLDQWVATHSEPLMTDDIMAAASPFKTYTAIGVDGFPPRVLG